MLEVSSPGIDRPLRTPGTSRFAGETVTVKTTGPIDGRSSFTGELLGFEDGCVIVAADGRHLPHSVRQHQKGPR
ncbi:MAG: ribosome maturation factor RimP [Adlercreutzia equolifaciens]